LTVDGDGVASGYAVRVEGVVKSYGTASSVVALRGVSLFV
jgi:hypothetical protein